MDYLTKWLRFNLLSILIFSGASAFGVELEPKTVRDFSAGLITDQDSTLIPDGAAQDLENVDVDSGSIEKRRGSIKANSSTLGSYSSQAVRFIHEYTDSSNNIWMITITSASIYGSKDGGTTNQLITSTHGFTTTSLIRAVNAFGSVWIVDGSTNAISWNGTSVTVQSNVPRGTVIAFWGGRLWVAGVSSTPSTLYGSKIADGTDWTQDSGLDSDAFSALVRNQDGYKIRAIAPFGRDLLVFKDRSIDRVVVLSDGQTYQLLPVTSHIGTAYPETITLTDNAIVWLAHDGIYSYNGSTIRQISKPIQPELIGLPQLSAASRSYTETTQANFQLGTSSGVSSSITPDSVVLSTWTDTDTTADDFSLGTLTNVTTSTVSGTVYLSTSDTNVTNNSFESGFASGWAASGCSDPSTCSDLAITGVVNGSYSMQLQANTNTSTLNALYLKILDNSGSEIGSSSDLKGSLVDNTSVQLSVSLLSYRGRYIKLRFYASYGSGNLYFDSSSSFLCSGETVTFYAYKRVFGSQNNLFFDYVLHGQSSITSGSFLSSTFDTSFSSPAWTPTTTTTTANGHTISWQTQSSDDGSSFEALSSWTAGSSPTSSKKRYIRYKASFTASTSGTALPFISDVSLSARQSFGRYVSSHITLSGITSWGVFSENSSSDGGTITYSIYTDTDTTMPLVNMELTQFVSSQTITTGNTPTISTNTYAVIMSSFAVSSSTQNPQMNDFTVGWGEGNTSLFPTSLFFEQKYYLAVAVNDSSHNDTIFVYDQNGAWTKYTGLPVYRFGTYRNRMYFGANNDGYIVRMQIDDRYRDYNDSAISAFWIGKDQDLGYPITTKSLLRYYLTAEYTADSTLTASYGVDRGSLTSVTYDLDSTSGFFRQTIKPSSLTYGEGIQHRFKVSNSVIDEYFKILSVTGRWNLNTNP